MCAIEQNSDILPPYRFCETKRRYRLGERRRVKKAEAELYTILEVANTLEVTTQAVYKRLQQDADTMDQYLATKGGKKSLTAEGVESLAKLMGIEDPFGKMKEEEEPKTDERALVATEAGKELLSYLREENTRLREQLEELKMDLRHTQELREQDRRAGETERMEAAEARKRADIITMQALKKEEDKPRLLERIFRRPKKENSSIAEEA